MFLHVGRTPCGSNVCKIAIKYINCKFFIIMKYYAKLVEKLFFFYEFHPFFIYFFYIMISVYTLPYY